METLSCACSGSYICSKHDLRINRLMKDGFDSYTKKMQDTYREDPKPSELRILDNYPEVHHEGRIYQFLYSEQLNSWLCNFYYDPSNVRRRVVIERVNHFDHFYGN